jgi:NADP-dependent 3-hydroxy acid dehydrogenase YdfG
LVNNAGLARGLKLSLSARLDDGEAMADTKVRGPLDLTRAVPPAGQGFAPPRHHRE